MDELVQVCRYYEDLALSCFGPYGRLKAVKASHSTPASIFTSISGPLFQGVRPLHAFAQLLVAGTAVSQHAQFGDGGLASLYIATRIVQAVLEGSPSRSDLYKSCCALKALEQRITTYLSSGIYETLPCMPCETLQHYLALCHGVLSPKLACLLDAADIQHIASLAVEAFVMTLPDEGSSSSAAPGVSFQVVSGQRVQDSFAFQGVMLPAGDISADCLDIFSELSIRSRHHDSIGKKNQGAEVGILLLREALDLVGQQHGTNLGQGLNGFRGIIRAEQPAHMRPGDAEAHELEGILSKLDQLLSIHVDTQIVASQQGVHPVVHDWLIRRGVASLQRLGSVRIMGLSKVAGCLPLDSILYTHDTRAGAAGRVCARIEVKNGHQALMLTSADSVGAQPVTVFLTCPLDSSTMHIQSAAESALKLLRATVGQVVVAVRGAGVIERAIAQDIEGCIIHSAALALRQLGNAANRRLSRSIDGILPTRSASDMNASANEHNVNNDNAESSVMELLPCKLACLQRAFSTATQLIKLASR